LGGTSSERQITWPEGRRFAFSVFDDTDLTTLENGPPVYEVVTALGFRITKSVWPVAPAGPSLVGGTTCADPDYLTWVQGLQADGHEIGIHNASDHSSTREETIAALDRFKECFGHDPAVGADHAGNLEAMYWGRWRLTGLRGMVYGALGPILWNHRIQFQGHQPTSPYFWGDVCRDRVRYWRSFTLHQTNLLASDVVVPYHDADRPYVNWWFTATHAPTLEPFLDAVSDENLDRLEAQGGVCVIYTHFGTDFTVDGKVDPRFAEAMERLAARGGWLAPVTEILDHLRAEQGDHVISDRERQMLESRWIRDQVMARGWTEARKVTRRLAGRAK